MNSSATSSTTTARMHQSLSAIPSYASLRPKEYLGDKSLNTSDHGREVVDTRLNQQYRRASISDRPDFFLGGSGPHTPSGPKRKMRNDWIEGGNSSMNNIHYVEHKPHETPNREYKWKKRLNQKKKVESEAKVEKKESVVDPTEKETEPVTEDDVPSEENPNEDSNLSPTSEEKSVETEAKAASTKKKSSKKKKKKKKEEDEEDPLPTPKPQASAILSCNEARTPKAMATKKRVSTAQSTYENVIYGSLTGRLILTANHLVYDPADTSKSAKKVAWNKVQKHMVSPSKNPKLLLKIVLKASNKSLTFQVETREDLMELKKEITGFLKPDKQQQMNDIQEGAASRQVENSSSKSQQEEEDGNEEVPDETGGMEDVSLRLPFELLPESSPSRPSRDAKNSPAQSNMNVNNSSASLLDFSVMNLSRVQIPEEDEEYEEGCDSEEQGNNASTTTTKKSPMMEAVQEEEQHELSHHEEPAEEQDEDAVYVKHNEGKEKENEKPEFLDGKKGRTGTDNSVDGLEVLEKDSDMPPPLMDMPSDRPSPAVDSSKKDLNEEESANADVVAKSQENTKEETVLDAPAPLSEPTIEIVDDATSRDKEGRKDKATLEVASIPNPSAEISTAGTSCVEHEKIIQEQAKEISDLRAQLVEANRRCNKMEDKLDTLQMVLYQGLKQEGMRNIWT